MYIIITVIISINHHNDTIIVITISIYGVRRTIVGPSLYI